jgi:E3 ubiquitin-protein ligase MYCBP2
MDEVVHCYCGTEVPLKAYPRHFETCPKIEESDLNQYINTYFPYLSQESDVNLLIVDLEYQLNRLKAYRKQQFSPTTAPPIPSISKELCGLCKETSSTLITLTCSHQFCLSHIQETLPSAFLSSGELKCWTCQKPILHAEIRKTVGDDLFDAVLDEIAGPNLYSQGNKVTCPCGFEGIFKKRPIDLTLKDKFGETFSPEAAENYALSCFSCSKCKATRCLECSQSPYHLGWSCAEAARIAGGEICRYCEGLSGPGADYCRRKECAECFKQSCLKTLPCGHRCFGVAEDSICPPCLLCLSPSEQADCGICLEKLSAGPMVAMRCGHSFHYSCILQRLATRWTGNRISFGYAKCPLCTDWTVCETHSQLCEAIANVYKLYVVVRDKAVKLLNDDPEEQKQVTDASDAEYFNQWEKYAMDRFCFYECIRCKEPYFGGKKQCNIDEDPLHFQPDEMICLNCMVQAGAEACARHGTEFMQFKCRYCCSIAKYHCWGTSHFCENCHVRMTVGDDLTKKRPDQLPKCGGRLTCPLKLDHAPNGKEFLIGCGLCRDEQGLLDRSDRS